MDRPKEDIKDLNGSLKDHLRRADNAQKVCKRAIDGAYGRFTTMSELFDDAVAKSQHLSEVERRNLAKEFAQKASTFEFNISSDYQMDKHVPQWNFSPQPSQTYLFSKRVLFVHTLNW